MQMGTKNYARNIMLSNPFNFHATVSKKTQGETLVMSGEIVPIL